MWEWWVGFQVQVRNQLSPTWHPANEVMCYPRRQDKTHQRFVSAHKTLKTLVQDKCRCRIKTVVDAWLLVEGCLELLRWGCSPCCRGKAVPVPGGVREGVSMDGRFGPGVLQLVLCSTAQVALAEWEPQILFDSNVIIQYLVHQGTFWFFATSGEVVPSKAFQKGCHTDLVLFKVISSSWVVCHGLEQHVAGQSWGAWCHKISEGQWLLRHTQVQAVW